MENQNSFKNTENVIADWNAKLHELQYAVNDMFSRHIAENKTDDNSQHIEAYQFMNELFHAIQQDNEKDLRVELRKAN